MTRTAARRLAIQLSFAAVSGTDLTTDEFFESESFADLGSEDEIFLEKPGKKQMDYIRTLVNGVTEKRGELDGYIAHYARGWKLSRISRTALAVLRCAMYEILYMDEVPDAAAINEAVELCKGFDESEVVSFVNGILGSFVRDRAEGVEVRPVAEQSAEEIAAEISGILENKEKADTGSDTVL